MHISTANLFNHHTLQPVCRKYGCLFFCQARSLMHRHTLTPLRRKFFVVVPIWLNSHFHVLRKRTHPLCGYRCCFLFFCTSNFYVCVWVCTFASFSQNRSYKYFNVHSNVYSWLECGMNIYDRYIFQKMYYTYMLSTKMCCS